MHEDEAPAAYAEYMVESTINSAQEEFLLDIELHMCMIDYM